MILPQLSSAKRICTTSSVRWLYYSKLTIFWHFELERVSSVQDSDKAATHAVPIVVKDLFVHAPHLRDAADIVCLVHFA